MIHLRNAKARGLRPLIAPLVIALATSASLAIPRADAATSDERASAATRALFSDVKRTGPGCTIAVSRNGKVVFAEAYGLADLAKKTPMTPKTVVDIGSVSKQFTATAVALLLQSGDVALDDVVSDFLDGLPAWADTVTIDQLIHHTSGIPDYVDLLTDAGVEDDERSTDQDALDVLATAKKLNFTPGRRYEYSNSNYFLLGQVVESVMEVGIGTYVNNEIFKPLRLAAVMSESAKIPGKAKSYAREGSRWVSADSKWLQLGDGGVQTTPTQLVTWASQYWNPTIGTPAINTLRWRNAVATDEEGQRYGFGMNRDDVDGVGLVFSHTGSWGGFSSDFAVLPSQQLAVAGTCTSADLAVADTDFAYDVLELWAT